jgi:hypothetical protein
MEVPLKCGWDDSGPVAIVAISNVIVVHSSPERCPPAVSDKFNAARFRHGRRRRDQLQQQNCEAPMLRASTNQGVRNVLFNYGKQADLNAFISRTPAPQDGKAPAEADVQARGLWIGFMDWRDIR